jgi:glycosyltransferase involved in cell wall biosynthesis
MSNTPLVSVITTVYNGEQYLTQAIESIQRQSLTELEYVIVDDGSDDRTPDILAGAQADPRLKVISQPRIGRAKALNVAWRQAGGAYIANLDVDDLAEPNRLETQLRFLEQHPEVGLVGTACKILDEQTGTVRLRRLMQTDEELRRALIRHNPFVHSSVMMPRRVLEAVGGYNEMFPVSIDHELWVRLARHYQLANLAEPLTIKRMNRQAYFQNRISTWKKYKTRVKIRWYAWRHLSRRLIELPYVVDPTGQWLYTRMGNSWRSTNQSLAKG